MLFIMVYQGRWLLKSCTILFSMRGGINCQSPDIFLLAPILFCFTKKTVRVIIAASICIFFHLTFNHNINCYKDHEVDEGEKAYQDEDWGGVHCYSK